MAIILDGIVQSAPRINSAISGNGIISGDYKQKEVEDLAQILTAGGLPASLDPTPLSEQVVSATLGQDTIKAGVTSMLVATGVVVVFMVIYYRFAGLVANLALLLNVTLTVAFMIMFNAAFTPAVWRGLALTVGMAVDANVLIYERMREELAKGSTLRMAIRNGFDRASITIIDANLTTLITAIVLYMIGTDQIKGFAVTLTVGLLMNLFTAITVSRLVFDVGRTQSLDQQLEVPANHERHEVRLLRQAALLLRLVDPRAWYRPGRHRDARLKDILNIDFTGGTSVTTVFDQAPAGGIAEVRKQVESVLPEATVQEVSSQDFEAGKALRSLLPMRTATTWKEELKKLFGAQLARYKMTAAITKRCPRPVPSACTGRRRRIAARLWNRFQTPKPRRKRSSRRPAMTASATTELRKN